MKLNNDNLTKTTKICKQKISFIGDGCKKSHFYFLQSGNLHKVSYNNTDWMQNSKNFKKSLLLFGLGSQKPVQLKALGAIVVGFNTVLSVSAMTIII